MQVSSKALIGPRADHMATGLVESRRGDRVRGEPCLREEFMTEGCSAEIKSCKMRLTAKRQLSENTCASNDDEEAEAEERHHDVTPTSFLP